MLKIETRQIDGLDVTSQQLPATRSYRLLPKVLKLIVPVLGATRGKKGIDDVDVAALAPVLEQLDDATMDALLLETLVCTSVVTTNDKGAQVKYDLTSKQWIDAAFGGNVVALVKTMAFALQLNFAGVFHESAGAAQQTPTPSS